MQFPAFPGMVKHRTAQEIALFVGTMQKAGLDPVAVATVIESESARTWSPSIHGPKVFSDPPGYPVGLIQFAPATAKALGTSTSELESMSFLQQLKYVVKFFKNAGGGARLTRLVDYYLAGFGSGIGTASDYVLATAGSPIYEANKALDKNGDGQITTGDLSDWVGGLLAGANANGSIKVAAIVAGAGLLEIAFWATLAWLGIRVARKAHT